MNQRISVRRLVYTLKKSYGQQVDVYNNTDAAPVDTTTGRRTVARIKYSLRRVVVIPKELKLTQLFTLPFTHSTGRPFQFGVYFGKELTTLLIDGSDLPPGVVINEMSQYIFNGKRYETNHIENVGGLAYLVLCQRCEGTPRDAVFDPPIYDSLRFVESASAEVI
jgi:hypothetical protein